MRLKTTMARNPILRQRFRNAAELLVVSDVEEIKIVPTLNPEWLASDAKAQFRMAGGRNQPTSTLVFSLLCSLCFTR